MENLEGIQDPDAQETELQQEQETEITEPQEIEGEPGTEEPPAYEPDFKFKYKDEEFEFDERLRGIVKDKDTEQYIRDLVTAEKAIGEYKEIGGIRELQEKLGNYEKYEQGFNSHEELNNEINQLSAMLATNSTAGVEQFRQHLGIDKQLLLKWAAEEAQAMQNPDQAQQIYQQRQMNIDNFNLQYQNQVMHNNIETQQIQQRNADLDSLLGSNEVSKTFDNLVGTPGSFREEVIKYGTEVFNSTGKVLSYDQAINAVQTRYQGLVTNQNSGTNTQVAQNPAQETAQVAQKTDPQKTVVIRQEGKQTLPNIGGGAGSPAKQKFTSLDAIRAHQKTL